jgi:hypothetical protein
MVTIWHASQARGKDSIELRARAQWIQRAGVQKTMDKVTRKSIAKYELHADDLQIIDTQLLRDIMWGVLNKEHE